ncbi:Ig-like domain-containing protein, partial [uncultured Flavobacterium sp.]|uniref:Ig-like domain-containing protein n=1 Tax=uncultured Flavobacterium sp. TaxID=165435 RepID=UPI0030EB597F
MRNKIIFGLILLVNFLGYSQDIDLTLKYNTTLNRYEVYARPDFTQNSFTWGPSQISVLVPESVANSPLQNLTSFNAGNWGDNSIIYAPTPQPQSDFHGVDSGGALTNLVAGQELLIFSFTINGGCTPGLRLFNNGVDPDSSVPGMFGGDFRNSIDNGMITDVYNVNYNNSGTLCIDAIDDNMSVNFPNGGAIGNVFSDNGFGQDTLYSTPISNPALVNITVLTPNIITGLTISPNGDVNVPVNTPPGEYQVEYQICEVAVPSNCDSAIIFITVNAQIIAEDDTITASEIGGIIGNIFPDNGVNPDSLNGNPITVGSTVIITLLDNGGLTGLAIDNNGNITIPINSNINGGMPYIAEYQICDALNPTICDTAFINITIEPSIVAEDDNNFTISYSEQGIVGNIFNDNGLGIDSLEGIAITNPALVNITISGVSPLPGLVINPNGDIFVPLNTTPQSYSIEYQICEVANPSNCDTAIFTIYVIQADDDNDSVNENSSVDVDIFFNDTLFIGDPNVPQYGTLTISTLPTNGTVTVSDPNATPLDPKDDIVSYTPNANYSGPDSFEYTICNNNTPTPNCDTALVTINVIALVNVEDDTIVTDEDTPVVVDIFNNDTDIPTVGTLTVTQPTNGTVVITDPNNTPNDPSDDVVTYTPNPDYNGPDTFTYTVCDNAIPTPNCDTATVNVTVNPIVDTEDDFDTTDINTPVNVDILDNDNDIPTNGTLTTTNPTNGTVVINNGGTPNDPSDDTVTYTPNTGFTGTDVFTYTLCDNATPTPNCDTATVTITVSAVPFNTEDDNVVTDEDTPVVVDIFNNDT